MKRLLLSLALLLLVVACGQPAAEKPVAAAGTQETGPITLGNADQGKQLITMNGCNVCHAIPGIEGAQGSLGPSLAGLGSRSTISMGKVQNNPANLIRFIQNPASVNPQSGMPMTNLTPEDAQHVAAYLMALK